MGLVRSIVGNFAALLAIGGVSWAADQEVLGKKLIVKNPTGNEANRTVIVLGKESPTDAAIANAPAVVSASLRVILNGDNPTDLTYSLGTPGQWQPAGTGLKYTGGGPVRLVQLKQSANGTFTLMDQALDLPAPMALSLQGNAQLLPP